MAAEIASARGTARVYPVDLTDGQAALEAFGCARADLGRPAVLVNSAGAGQRLFLEETSPAEAVQMMAAPAAYREREPLCASCHLATSPPVVHHTPEKRRM